jgi:hypothetical protein
MREMDVPIDLIKAVNAEKEEKKKEIAELESQIEAGFQTHVQVLTTLVEGENLSEKEAAARIVVYLKEMAEKLQKAKAHEGPATKKLCALAGWPDLEKE